MKFIRAITNQLAFIGGNLFLLKPGRPGSLNPRKKRKPKKDLLALQIGLQYSAKS